MPSRNDTESTVIYASGIPTDRLVALALTMPVAETGNELFGRSHAFYAIAHTQVAAIEFMLRTDETKRRVYAAGALAMAGHRLTELEV